MKCHHRSERETEFLELEVNLVVGVATAMTNRVLTRWSEFQNKETLENRIDALLCPEDLNGDNK